MSKQAEKPIKLEDRWVSAGAAEALEAVQQAGVAAEALVTAWTSQANAAAIQEVAERGQGPARKAARRALNVLKSRGIKPPPPLPASAARPDRATTCTASLVAPDGAGTVLLIFDEHTEASRHRVAYVFLRDGWLLERVELTELGGARLRDALKRMLPTGYAPVPVPLDWARHRVAAGRARQSGLGIPLPMGLSSAASLLEPAPAEPPAHPFDDEGLVLDAEDAKALGASSASLHLLPEFRGLFPPDGAVQELLLELGKQVDPASSPEPEVFGKLLEAQIDAATDRFFAPQRREAMIPALKDAALAVLARDGEQRALEVVAVMGLIERAGLITDPPHEVPFLRAFFEKAVSLLLQRGNGQLRIPVAAPPAAPSPGEP